MYPKKASGKPRISYNDAVEEALCFGWIDSTVKSVDEDHYAQRFTPRDPDSTYSQANKERLRWLKEQGKIHLSMSETVDRVLGEEFVWPEDIIRGLKEDEEAWKNFQTFSPSYKRIRVAYIDHARGRPKEFQKRLENFISKTRNNKKIGYGGIEKYY